MELRTVATTILDEMRSCYEKLPSVDWVMDTLIDEGAYCAGDLDDDKIAVVIQKIGLWNVSVTLDRLIRAGLVEICGRNEAGEQVFGLSDFGREIAAAQRN
jgi:hypothetical protein